MAKFEDTIKMNLNCSMGYISARQKRAAGIIGQTTLGAVLDLGAAIEKCEPYVRQSCLRNGLMLDTRFTVATMHDYNFTMGDADLVGLCDITRCKCDADFAVTGVGLKHRTRHCFENLVSGKCVDEYVRQTVGCTLLPNLYTKDKQR